MSNAHNAPLFIRTERPPAGRPCSVEQLVDHVCDDAGDCPHAARCAAQDVGPMARCFAANSPHQDPGSDHPNTQLRT